MRYSSYITLFVKGYGKYKAQIAAMVLLALMSAFAESIGVTALIPLFSKMSGVGISDDLGSSASGAILGWLDLGVGFKILLPLIVFAFILKSLLLLLTNYFSAKVAADYERDARSELIRRAFGANWSFLIRQKVGYLETILIKDVDMARVLFVLLSQGVINVASLAVYIFVAYSISGQITLLSLAIGGVVFLVIKPFLHKVKELSNAAMKIYSDTAHHIGENIIGIKAVKTSSSEWSVSRVADHNFNALRDIQIRLKLLHEIPRVLYEPMGVVFVVSIFAFLFITKDFELGVFVAAMYLVHRIFTYIQGLQAVTYKINESTPFLKRIVDLRDEMTRNEERYEGREPFGFSESLKCSDVWFAYNTGKDVLRGLNFTIRKGEMTGIVGKSGAGKTTIVDLLLRLMKPSSGVITVDGVDISQINMKDWRRNISYVPQEAFMINGTIENNIKFYDAMITTEDMERAAKMANIYDFIQAQQEKFKTEVGERGILFSGGEKQRIVLARALARNPRILVLDEATSALDNESELMVQRAIEGLKGKITLFVIAHRLTTLLNCDKIIFLENGKIEEEGPPRELLKDKDSSFYRLYNIRDNNQ